jgi:hypothetical protein
MPRIDDVEGARNVRRQVIEHPSSVEMETGATFESEATPNTTQPLEQGIPNVYAINGCKTLNPCGGQNIFVTKKCVAFV